MEHDKIPKIFPSFYINTSESSQLAASAHYISTYKYFIICGFHQKESINAPFHLFQHCLFRIGILLHVKITGKQRPVNPRFGAAVCDSFHRV